MLSSEWDVSTNPTQHLHQSLADESGKAIGCKRLIIGGNVMKYKLLGVT
jgi:predicted DNA-binding protein with PD1-like motif